MSYYAVISGPTIAGGGMGVRWGAIYKRSVKIAAASKTGVYSLILVTLG